MARNNTSLPPEQRRQLDELEASLRDAGVSREALHRLGMAFGGGDPEPENLADKLGVDVDVTVGD